MKKYFFSIYIVLSMVFVLSCKESAESPTSELNRESPKENKPENTGKQRKTKENETNKETLGETQ